MTLIHYIVYAIWFLSELLINLSLRSSTSDRQNKDKDTLALLWMVIMVSNLTAVFVAMNIQMPISSHYRYVSYSGLAIIVMGVIFRVYAIASLGRMFTVDVTIRDGHALKKDGIYRYLRHPSYAGAFISFIGFGISLDNWLTLFIVIIPVGLAFARRIRIEEAALTEAFGQAYIDYRKGTYAILPFVY